MMRLEPEAAKVGGMKLALLPVALAVVLATGCGGGSSSSSSSPSPKDWSNNLCTAITDWSNSVKKSGQSLQSGGVSKDQLKQTTSDIKSATHKFAEDLKGLGKPNTASGQDAKDAIDQLATQVDSDVDELQKAADKASGSGASGAVAAASGIASTLSKMGSQISSAATKLQSADAKGDLQKAFQAAPACKNLTG
jgi:hypothetical protein